MDDLTEIVRRVEETSLDGLKDVDVEDVYVHMDVLLRDRPGPLDLYRRWEQQQWSASALDFSHDRRQWERFDPFTRDDLQGIFSGFFVGEQAVTDTLSPLLHAAPDEESRLFLATQVVDEARHAYFFARFFEEVLEVGGTIAEAIGYARDWTDSEAYNQVFDRDLVQATDAVRLNPGDYGKWVEGITIYHLMIEGILALTGQRLLLRGLRQSNILPAFRSGFTAVTRDESRHVNFGVWALQQAVGRGYTDAIRSAVDRTFRPCLRIYANPEFRIVIPESIPVESRVDPRMNWSFALDSLTKRLRAAGIDGDYLVALEARGWEIIWEAVGEYERRHGEHPVRFWERREESVSGR